jgi:hypothetical protein
MAAKPTHYFTTSEGVESVTRTTRRYIVVYSASGQLVARTDDQTVAVGTRETTAGTEVIDLQTDGRDSKPRTVKVAEPAKGYVELTGGGKVRRRHIAGDTGSLCHPEADVEPATGDGAVCKNCERIAAKGGS